MNLNNEPPPMGDALRSFALACRRERDRLAQQRLAEADRRFDAASDERVLAERLAARAIAEARR